MTDPTDVPSGVPAEAPTEALTRRSARSNGGGPAAAPKSGGIGALIRRHPTAWLAGAIAVGFLLLGTSALFAGVAVGSSNAAEPGGETPAPDPRLVPSPAPTSVPIRSCSIAAQSADPRLMSFYGTVLNANDGTVLFDRQGTTPASTGSVMKVLTAAAALEVLGPDYRFTTTVQVGSQPNTIVLIGGGDPTLARYGSNVYPGSASLIELANQTNAAWASSHPPNQDIENIVLDSSMWDRNDKWDSSWDRIEQQLGYSSEVTALMVDGDRADPYSATSPRSTDPITRAGEAFAEALGVPGANLTFGTGIGGQQLGQVQSPTISELIPYMLNVSDNTLADQLSRVISVESGFGGSSASINNAFQGALRPYGIPTDGMVFRDGSGLSDLNAVTTTYIAQFMQKVRLGGPLQTVYDGLPVAGQSGTLAWRFTGANAVATGAVIAKTGMLEREWAMGGIINAQDGTPLTFAVYAIGDGIPDDAPDALDQVVASAFLCGNNLSNY